MGGHNSILPLSMLYCAAAAEIQTTGTSGEESRAFLTRMLTIVLCAALFIISARFLHESYSGSYCGLYLTSLDVFQGGCLGVKEGKKARFFYLCPSTYIPLRNVTL